MKHAHLAILLVASLSGWEAAADAARGLDVARRVDQANSGWKTEEVRSTMTLIAADGRSTTRLIRTRAIEMAGDGDRSLVVFDRPRDVKGTVFLTHAHKRGADDQWLFLPALKRVKRIASNNRSGPFMGSEFAYEDIASEEVERYTYAYLREEAFAGHDCLVYERRPVDANSGYSRQVVFADASHYRVHRVDYYDRKGTLQKTLTRSGYRKVDGFWRAARWEMVNHLNDKRTVVDWDGWTLGGKLTPRQFEKGALDRYR